MKDKKEKVVEEAVELTTELFLAINKDKTSLLDKLKEFREECIIQINTLKKERSDLKKQKRELNKRLRVNWKRLFGKKNEKRKLTREIKVQNSLIVDLANIYADQRETTILKSDFYPENPKTR